mgnify:CR=1 FL=1
MLQEMIKKMFNWAHDDFVEKTGAVILFCLVHLKLNIEETSDTQYEI